MKLRNLIILAVVCYAMPTLAQDTKQDTTVLKRELTLEKEYTPTIREAAKVGTLPELKEPEAPKTKVEFAKFSVPYEISPELMTLPSGSYFTDVPYSKKRGYLKAGVSSFVDIDGDLGYQILNSETDRLSIFGSHRSSNGNVTYLQDDEKQKMKINDNLLGLGYLHDFGGLRLNADVKYTYSAFNYYGYTMPNHYLEPGTELSLLPGESYAIDKDISQVDNIFDIGAGIVNDRPNELNYSFNLSNTIFNQKYLYTKDLDGVKENRFTAGWDVHKGFNSNMNIGFGGYWKNYNYTTPNNAVVFNCSDYDNVMLNPYFGIEGDNWDLRLGVKVNLLLMPGDNENNIAPDIRLNYRPMEKLNFYIAAEGGVADNSGSSMFQENRYVMPGTRVLDSRSPLDGKIGIQGSPSGNFWFDVFAGYKITNDEHFFLTGFVPMVGQYTNETLLLGGMINPVYYDAKAFLLGGNIKYNYQDIFEFGLKATYYNWDVSSDYNITDLVTQLTYPNEPWNKVNFETELTATYNVPQLPLRLDASYYLGTGRKTIGVDGVENMKNINNLGVSGTYKFNETFSIFAKANNLLFQKYDLFYGYPAQNFSIMGGLSILF